jgi:D-inositol-3-phosphate glycosyltransferase
MRIAMVSEHASPLALLGSEDAGGQNVYVAALAAELGRRGHQVVVHTRRETADVPRRVPFTTNVVVHHVDAGPPKRIPKDDIWPHIDAFADDLVATWDRDQPEVVHAHFWMSGIAALEAAARHRVPVLQTFHALGSVKRREQGAADTSPPDRLDAERRIVAEADRIIATCSDEAFELRQLGGSMDRVSIVPCGVNLDNFGPDGDRLARRPDLTHRLAVVSRLVPRKGVDDALRALASVPDTELVVAGGPPVAGLDDDPEVARLRAIAGEADVADRVRFLGALERHEVPPVMRSSDALVTVPWYEPFGIVPLEAMACGVPVVTASVGGMIDTVVDGVTGIHVPPREPEALADALNRLLAAPDLRRRLGRNGIRRVRSRYSWERVADGAVRAYRDAIAAPAARERRVVSG